MTAHDWQIEANIKTQKESNNRRLVELSAAVNRLAELKNKAEDEQDGDTQEALTNLAFSFGATFFTPKLKRNLR